MRKANEIRSVKSQLLNWPKRGGPCAAVVLVLLAGKLSSSRGQEAVRMSIASAEAAEARRRAATSIGYYNLKLGPTAWNFGTGLGIEYNSNVQNTGSNPEGDFYLSPTDEHADAVARFGHEQHQPDAGRGLFGLR